MPAGQEGVKQLALKMREWRELVLSPNHCHAAGRAPESLDTWSF